jgi:hypothetical protein
VNDASAAQQALGFGSVAHCQEVHRRTSELASLPFDVLHLLQFGATPATGLGAVDQSPADRTLHHDIKSQDRRVDR